MVALRNVNAINTRLDKVQNRVSTGLRVAGALDDASNFSIAQGIRGEVRALAAITQGLNTAKGIVKVALAGATAVSNLVTDLKAKIIEGANAGNTAQQQVILDNDYTEMLKQMRQVLENSEFNGINVVIETAVAFNTVVGQVRDVNVLSNLAGGNIQISGQRIDLFYALLANEDLTSSANANTALTVLDGNVSIVNNALGSLGADMRTLNLQTEFLESRSDATEEGLGNIVDANMAREAANLTGLQVQQQLATQTLAIANSSPQYLASPSPWAPLSRDWS